MQFKIEKKKMPFKDYLEKVVFPNLTDDYKNNCLKKDNLNTPEKYSGFIMSGLNQ